MPGTEAAFIDTVKALVPCQHLETVRSGENVWVNPDGDSFLDRRNAVRVAGPFGATISVCSAGKTAPHTHLEIAGSPLKFLQGHNLFGPCDLFGLLTATAHEVTERLGLSPTADDLKAWQAGEYELKQVDCTAMFGLGNRETVDEALGIVKTGKHRFLRSKYEFPNSVYFGGNSSHLTVKIYGKGEESERSKHGLLPDLPHREELLAWADDKLRFEVSVKARKLGEWKAASARYWTPQRVMAVVDEQIGNIRVNPQQELFSRQLGALSRTARLIYHAWRAGEDIKRLYKGNATYYKYQKELVSIAGIDIGVTCEAIRSDNSVLASKLKTIIGISNSNNSISII